MKKIIGGLITLGLLWTANVYSYGLNSVYTIFNDSCAPCYKNCPFMGLYFLVNIGYSWTTIMLHRPDVFDLPPLNRNSIEESADCFSTALGYDLYPCKKFPARFEISYFYTDQKFTLNPLFRPGFDEDGFVSDDRFLIRNLMTTLYFDWHTCTRWVPYIGISAGLTNLKTYHHPSNIEEPTDVVFKHNETNFSWGSTIGTRYFFTNYLFGNAQLRYSNHGTVSFRNFSEFGDAFLPNHEDYLSDYLHETSVMIGLGYVF